MYSGDLYYRELRKVPMPLDASRRELEKALERSNLLTSETMPLVQNWWRDYKDWEAQDKFLPAFSEGRMTIRQRQVRVPGGRT